jgi:hypothetical protein
MINRTPRVKGKQESIPYSEFIPHPFGNPFLLLTIFIPDTKENSKLSWSTIFAITLSVRGY